MNQKQTFKYILAIFSLFLVALPFLITFNDVLTRLVMRLEGYVLIQKYIIPFEIRMAGAILLPFGYKPEIVGEYLTLNNGQPFMVEIAWNCIGWQSILFFVITCAVALQGDKYKNSSKVYSFLVGILGTFLINLLRICIVVLISYHFGQSVAIIFHDYFSTLINVFWLILFWWFSYSYILEEKGDSSEIKSGVVTN